MKIGKTETVRLELNFGAIEPGCIKGQISLSGEGTSTSVVTLAIDRLRTAASWGKDLRSIYIPVSIVFSRRDKNVTS